MEENQEIQNNEPIDTADETPVDGVAEVKVSSAFPIYSVAIILLLAVVFGTQLYYDVYGIGLVSIPSAFVFGLIKGDVYHGEYWRVLTSSLVHLNLPHLVLTMLAFISIGRLFESVANRAHLAVVFVISAIGASLVSYSFLNGPLPSVGASGAVCGLLGYLAIYGFLRRQLLSKAYVYNMVLNVILIAVIGGAFNYLRPKGAPMIDNLAHVGGFLSGALYGLVQVSSDLTVDPREGSERTEIAGLIAIGLIFAAGLFVIATLLGLFRF